MLRLGAPTRATTGMDKYAQAFADAMNETGMRNTTVAAQLEGIGYNNVSQWRTGRRPIPADHAPAIAALLDVPPERISKAYARRMHAESVRTASTAGVLAGGGVPAEHVALLHLPGFGRGDGGDRIVLPEFIVRRELGPTAIEHVRWAAQLSRAMEPEIKRFALVLIDTTVTRHEDVVDGGIYAYTLWGRPDIRRVLIRRDAWCLVGQGGGSERIEVAATDLAYIRIHGAVTGWL